MQTALRVKFPDDQGKNRELHAFVELLPPQLLRKSASLLAFFWKFPTRGNIRTETDRRRLRILTAVFRGFERMGYHITTQRAER